MVSIGVGELIAGIALLIVNSTSTVDSRSNDM